MSKPIEKFKILRFEKDISNRFRIEVHKEYEEYSLDNQKAYRFKSKEEIDLYVDSKLNERKRMLQLEGTLTNKEILNLFPDYKFLKLAPKDIKKFSINAVLSYKLFDDWQDEWDDRYEYTFSCLTDLEYHIADKYNLFHSDLELIMENVIDNT